MASKITPEMLELLLPQKTPPALLIPRWGVVTSIAPLRVQLAGDDDPLPITPKTLTGGLLLGGVVWCVLQGADLIVVSQLGGADTVVTGTVTGRDGDGVISILQGDDVVRIRTGEHGVVAI